MTRCLLDQLLNCAFRIFTIVLVITTDRSLCDGIDIIGLTGRNVVLPCNFAAKTCLWEHPNNGFYRLNDAANNGKLKRISGSNCSIIVQNLIEEDDGTWNCLPLDASNIRDKLESKKIQLTIIKKPNVFIQHPKNIIMDEQIYIFYCESRNGHPIPNLTWCIRNDTDILYKLKAESQNNTRVSENKPYAYNSRSLLYYQASYEHSGNTLSCIADMTNGVNLTDFVYNSESHAKLLIFFKPKLWKNFNPLVRLSRKNAVMYVSFVAYPAPKPDDFFWTAGDTRIDMTSSSSNYKAYSIESNTDDTSSYYFKIRLDIYEVHHDSYTLTVTNSVGTTSFHISVIDGPTSGSLSSSAIAGIVVSVIFILVFIFLIIFLKEKRKLCFKDNFRYPWRKSKFSSVPTSEQHQTTYRRQEGHPTNFRFVNPFSNRTSSGVKSESVQASADPDNNQNSYCYSGDHPNESVSSPSGPDPHTVSNDSTPATDIQAMKEYHSRDSNDQYTSIYKPS